MTNAELNRDIKRLQKAYLVAKEKGSEVYYNAIEVSIKPEFKRLYYADKDFTAMNRTSILIMLRLHVLLRIVPFHQFGLFIELDEL